jgi:FixJ family two-component response regulator
MFLAYANKLSNDAFHTSGATTRCRLPGDPMGAFPTISIIDDEEAVRESVSRLIATRGYRTEVYASAEDFIEQVIGSAASCLIIDVQLKDLTGIELSRHLNALGYSFKIIFMSASDDPAIRNKAMEQGCVAFLQKPLCQRALFDAIAKAAGTPDFADNSVNR